MKVLNSIDGVEFAEAFKNKQKIDIGDIIVFYIGLRDFIKNKEAAGRNRDISDVKELQGPGTKSGAPKRKGR